MNTRFFLVVSLALTGLNHSNGLDWPTYGGPNRNHSTNEESLRLEWGNDEPQTLWSLEVGLGYSSVVEVDGRAYTQGYSDNANTLYCVDVHTGKILWRHRYPSGLGDKYFQGGTRSTPTVHDGRVYLQGHEGSLFCLLASTGKVLWQTHLVEDLQGRRPTWGYSGAPLVANGMVIVQTGAPDGSLVALNESNGHEIWRGGSSEAGYASPCLRVRHPSEVLIFNQFGLAVHDLLTGVEKTSYQHKTRYEVNAAQPLDLGDRILVASGYGKGAALVDFSSKNPKVLWESDGVASQMASLVARGDFAFGIHGQTGTNAHRATLFCLEIESGRKVWEESGFGVGTIILVGRNLVVLSDRGELGIVKATANGFHELARFQVLGGKNNWTPPSYANGRMHCRASSGRWVCLSMGQK